MQANLKARLSSAGVAKISGRVDPKTVKFSAPRERVDQFMSCQRGLVEVSEILQDGQPLDHLRLWCIYVCPMSSSYAI